MLRICLFSRLFFLLLCGIESPLTLLEGATYSVAIVRELEIFNVPESMSCSVH